MNIYGFGPTFWVVSALLVAVISVGCSADDASPTPAVEQERPVREVVADSDLRVVVPVSVMRFRLHHTDRMVADAARVTFRGQHSARGAWQAGYPALLGRTSDVGDIVVQLPVSQGVWQDVMGDAAQPEARFDGEIEVELRDELGVSVRARLQDVRLDFVPRLQPAATSFEVGAVYVGEQILVEGGGFLRPEEGQSLLVVEEGALHLPDGSQRDLSGERVALGWSGQREQAYFHVDPGVFGVRAAQFSGRGRLENHPRDSQDVWQGQGALALSGELQAAYLAELSPRAGSRGQKIQISGRGLIPMNSAQKYGMLLRYAGRFVPDDPALPTMEFQADTAQIRPPDHVLSEQLAEQNVWYEIEAGRTLSGLGATPGVFTGSIVPIFFDRYGEHEGIGWQGDFRVLPTRQVVYLKYLPSFSTGLDKYGLRNVELEIRKRILEVARRDYLGINVDFREELPADFIDFTTVEMGGPDPSGYQSFGYDNSYNDVAKDTGNLYLADYLGGVNAQSGQQFNNPYGGIFLESFSFFSAELNPDNPYASGEFDRIMRPFMPALGGRAVSGTEWPQGARSAEIAQAIHMVGSVLGNTLSHELGHALGLTFVPEDEVEPTDIYHNLEYGPYIMDPGSERPFEERAEINGQGPAVFSPQNRAYLQKYLPRVD